jgi:hypothetical protein
MAEGLRRSSSPIRRLRDDAIPSTGFRKWVVMILSTTQVTDKVIILALLFIYRLKKINPTVKGKVGSEYRLLTVALMLGNKCKYVGKSSRGSTNFFQSWMTTHIPIRRGLKFLESALPKFMLWRSNS